MFAIDADVFRGFRALPERLKGFGLSLIKVAASILCVEHWRAVLWTSEESPSQHSKSVGVNKLCDVNVPLVGGKRAGGCAMFIFSLSVAYWK